MGITKERVGYIMRIYVSGPYTKGDQMMNIRNAILAADQLYSLGHIPYVPHLTGFWHMVTPRSWEEWLRIDRAFIPCCDALLRIPGESKGADIEMAYARALKIPVYFNLEDIPKE